jgi:pilus assembly protein Flp/PilA
MTLIRTLRTTEYPATKLVTNNISWIGRLLSDESGQDLIEYALVAGIIALGATVAMRSVTTATTTVFASVATKI